LTDYDHLSITLCLFHSKESDINKVLHDFDTSERRCIAVDFDD